MRTFTTEHTVYTFEELTPEVQKKVISDFQQNEDFYWLEDIMQEQLQELLKKYNFKSENAKVYFDLSHCQGAGAMFEGKVFWKSYTIDVKQSGHYYHYNSKTLDIYSTKTDKQASDAIYNEFDSIYIDLCRDLERFGYKTIEATLEDSNIIECIQEGKYEFYADGKIA